MALDRRKLAIWAVVLGLVTGAVILRTERHDRMRHVTPAAPTPPVVAAVPPAPLPPPPLPVPEPPALPILVAPAPPAAVPTPAPDPRRATKGSRKPAKKVKLQPKRKAAAPINNCARVPAQAYQFPAATVVSVAKSRGISDADMAILKACIKYKDVNAN